MAIRFCDKSTAQIEAIDPYTIGITIQDEGSGFNYKSFPVNIPDANTFRREEALIIKAVTI